MYSNVFDLPSQDPAASAMTVSLPWNVLFQGNSFLTGRDDLLAQVQALLRRPTMAALTQALSGLGDISRLHGVHSLLIAFDQQGKARGQVEIASVGEGTERMTVLLVEHYEDMIPGDLAGSPSSQVGL